MNFVPRFFPIFFLSLLYLYVLFSPFLFCRGRIFSVAFLTVHLTRIFLGAGFQFDFRFVGLFGVFPVENLSTRERARSRGCGTFGARLEFLFFFFFFFHIARSMFQDACNLVRSERSENFIRYLDILKDPYI